MRARALAMCLALVVGGPASLQAQDETATDARNKGKWALEENRLDDAIAAYKRSLQLFPRYAPCAYDLARAYSRKGDAATALEWLAHAADWGFEDVAHLLADPDLANVQSNPRFAQIVEGIQNRLPPSKPRPWVASEQPDRGVELVAMVRNELGSGAGILLSRDGDRVYIATANHVVRQGGEDATAIDVQLKALSPRWLRAKLLPPAGDPELDLAILAVDLPSGSELDFCALPLHLGGDSTHLRRGDPVYPVGYPGGVLWAMPLAPDHATQVFPSQISFESQFVRVGFSGGALLNKHGEIVGMIAADEPPFGRAVPLALILDAVRAAGYPVQLSTPEDAAQRPLHLAAKAGNLAAVRRLLESCADPDAADPSGRTALHEAAVQGSADAIRLLVRAGARLHAWAVIREDAKTGREWGTPLHLAAQHGNVEAVKALLAGDEADIKTLWKHDDDERVEQASTALHFAVRHDRGEVADVLLAAGAYLNAVDGRENRTPLEMAAAHGSLSAARVLVRRGAPRRRLCRCVGEQWPCSAAPRRRGGPSRDHRLAPRRKGAHRHAQCKGQHRVACCSGQS